MGKNEVFLKGRSTAAARALLAAAEQAGLEPEVVRSVTGGYRVPQAVVDALGPAEGEKVPAPEAEATQVAPEEEQEAQDKVQEEAREEQAEPEPKPEPEKKPTTRRRSKKSTSE